MLIEKLCLLLLPFLSSFFSLVSALVESWLQSSLRLSTTDFSQEKSSKLWHLLVNTLLTFVQFCGIIEFNDRCLLFTGTGKTTTLLRFTALNPNMSFLYCVYNKYSTFLPVFLLIHSSTTYLGQYTNLSFNSHPITPFRSVQEHAATIFPCNVKCRTFHSLAHGSRGDPVAVGSEGYMYLIITSHSSVFQCWQMGVVHTFLCEIVTWTLKIHTFGITPSVLSTNISFFLSYLTVGNTCRREALSTLTTSHNVWRHQRACLSSYSLVASFRLSKSL